VFDGRRRDAGDPRVGRLGDDDVVALGRRQREGASSTDVCRVSEQRGVHQANQSRAASTPPADLDDVERSKLGGEPAARRRRRQADDEGAPSGC
jgi:hypothetical protein